MLPWRGADRMGDHFSDLAEVVAATGDAGAFSFDPSTGDGEYVAVEPIGESSTWGADSNATAYVDRERVWLDGLVSTTGGSGALGTLPTGKRPASTVYLNVGFTNDLGGTATDASGNLTISSAGVVSLAPYGVSLTGQILVPMTGLSFKVAP